MPSLRKRVTTYLRQLSFSAEPRDRIGSNRLSLNKAGCSIARYVEGDFDVISRGPTIHYGKAPQNLPDLPIAEYSVGPETITAACTGPGDGLTCIQRSCSHLSAGPDIDFIDVPQSSEDTTLNNQNSCKSKDNRYIVKQLPNNKSRNPSQDVVNPEMIETSVKNNSKDIDINKNNNTSKDTSKDDLALIKNRKKSITTVKSEANENSSKNSDKIVTKSEKLIESSVISTSDTDSQSSIDVSIGKGNESTKELSKVEKEKLRLRNLPRYECRRTKTLSEMVLSRPRRELRKSDNVQNIVVVTKTLQVNSKTEVENNQNVLKNDESNLNNEDKISSQNQSEESQNIEINTKITTTNINNFDVSNSNIDKTSDNDIKPDSFCAEKTSEAISGVTSWDSATDNAFGISTSLYEHNPILGDRAGQPIADCYGLIARGNAAALALADGVNWGNGAKLAACSAINGCLTYLNKAIFGLRQGDLALTTREVFVSLLRSFWEAHACIIESGGALCTLTAAVILPLSGKDNGRSVVCVCNVGDSLAYVYSHVYGVREITQGSHDINSMRDMRDALGALGPVNGTNPELNNLTLSMTIVEPGDLVFLTSDGISDNFDPVVGRFAEAISQTPNDKEPISPQNTSSHNSKSRQCTENRSSKIIANQVSSKSRDKRTDLNLLKNTKSNRFTQENSNKNAVLCKPKEQNIARPQNRINIIESKHTERKVLSIDTATNRPKYTRSQTTLEHRSKSSSNSKTSESRPVYNRSMSGPEDCEVPKKQLIPLPRSKNGLPIVNGIQRHDLTLLRIADLLNFGINGMLKPCTNSKALCKLLIDFVKMITTGKRKMLEEKELYYCEKNGVLVQLTRSQQKAKRKEWIEKDIFKALPGKLDHATVVAYTIETYRNSKPAYCETDF